MKSITLIVVDGMRPDGLLKANAPTMKHLLATSAYSLQARTVLPSKTLPCITSLMLGVAPQMHGTLTNTFASQHWDAPGLIDLLHTAGYKTASFTNWEPLRDVSRPGALDLSICINTAESSLPVGESDTTLTGFAINALVQHPVDFTFLYLGCVDTAGHKYGWMSNAYIRAIEKADSCIGHLCEVLSEDTAIFITADHGGIGYTHGNESDAEMTIPFIAHSAGLAPGEIDGPVNLLDIAPTIAACAGLAAPSVWQGKSLLPIQISRKKHAYALPLER